VKWLVLLLLPTADVCSAQSQRVPPWRIDECGSLRQIPLLLLPTTRIDREAVVLSLTEPFLVVVAVAAALLLLPKAAGGWPCVSLSMTRPLGAALVAAPTTWPLWPFAPATALRLS